MSTARHDPLIAAARALADGGDVDWDALARAGDNAAGDTAGIIAQLRILQAISRACAAPIVPGEARADDPVGWGNLRIIEKVGTGGFGEVFRAFDPVLEREVALKLRRLSGEREEAAFAIHLEEARRLARVRHPNVLAVYGVEVHDGRAGMWTDFIHGETLESRVSRCGPLPIHELISVGLDLCAAVGAVHAAGLTHGDIKTANAMREESGRTILMDFGAGSPTAAREPEWGTSPQGTPIAMAPELIDGGQQTIASDLYALGVLLYRLSTGRYPIAASSWDELVDRHRHGEILPVRDQRPDLPLPLSRHIDRCLARAPEARPSSAAELEAALRACRLEGSEIEDRTAPSIQGDPPSLPGRFVGRKGELNELRGMLLEERWITLIGAGGSGKTRLALQAAEEAAGLFRDGAHWASLAALWDPELLPQRVARAFQVRESRQRTVREHLFETLRDRRALLVLDNCEHMIEAAAPFLRSMLDAAPGLTILATSRQPFGESMERSLRVPPLPLPASGAAPGLEIIESEAVRLFLDRASRRRPGLSLSPSNALSIARIVRRLDGIPLAIELAAARVEAMTVEQIANRLERDFRLISGRMETPREKHDTIRASIEWSYRMLSAPEQRLLARVSVFRGGWTLEAAEEVCAGTDDSPPTVELLEGLVRRSIVQFDADAPRYRLLETVREFAREKLRERNEETASQVAHLRWVMEMAARAGSRLQGPEADIVTREIDAELDNVREALACALAMDEYAEEGLRLCTALSRYWFLRESYREAVGHFGVHLARRGEPTPARGRCFVAAATVLWPIGEIDRAHRSAMEGLSILRATGDSDWIPTTLATIAFLADLKGDATQARACLVESLDLYAARGDAAGTARAAGNLGVLESRLGDHAAAIPHYERSISLLRSLGDEANAAVTLRNLAYSLLQRGELRRARELAEEGIGVLRRIGQRRQLATSLAALAELDLAEGETDAAYRHALEALLLARDAGEKVALLAALTTLAVVSFHQESDERAARLLGAVSALHETLAIPIGTGERAVWDRRLEDLRARLGGRRFAALWVEGRALDLDAALNLASI